MCVCDKTTPLRRWIAPTSPPTLNPVWWGHTSVSIDTINLCDTVTITCSCPRDGATRFCGTGIAIARPLNCVVRTCSAVYTLYIRSNRCAVCASIAFCTDARTRYCAICACCAVCASRRASSGLRGTRATRCARGTVSACIPSEASAVSTTHIRTSVVWTCGTTCSHCCAICTCRAMCTETLYIRSDLCTPCACCAVCASRRARSRLPCTCTTRCA
jgi:hypothetical protein